MLNKIGKKTLGVFFRLLSYFLSHMADAEFSIFNRGYKSIFFFRYLHLRCLRVRFGSNFYVAKEFYLFNSGGLCVGNYCSFGEFTRIWNFGQVEIGNDFMGAASLTILTGSHNLDTLEPYVANVKIGDRVWCGANVTILPGVIVGDDVVIAAASVVTKNIPSGVVVAGCPAKIIKNVDLKKRGQFFWSQRTVIKHEK